MEYEKKQGNRKPDNRAGLRNVAMLKLYAMIFSSAFGAIAGFGINRIYRFVLLQEMPATWSGFLVQLGAVGLVIYILWRLAWYYFQKSEQVEVERRTEYKDVIAAKDQEIQRLVKESEEKLAALREMGRALSLTGAPLSGSSGSDPQKDDA